MHRSQLLYPRFKRTIKHILHWQDSRRHPWDVYSELLKEAFSELIFIFLVGFGLLFAYPIHLQCCEVCARALGD